MFKVYLLLHLKTAVRHLCFTCEPKHCFVVNPFHATDLLLQSLKISENHTQPAFTCSKSTVETLEQGVKYVQRSQRRWWRRSGVFIVNFGHISHLALVFLLLTLNM